MKIKQLIKKSISQKTLFTDVFGYSLTKTGFADKYLAGQLTMYKSYSWLKKHFENDLKQIKTELPKEQNCDVAEKQVWICWLQGMENAPQIVQDCYASVCYWMKDWKITVITADNMNEYVQFPDYIVRKWKEGVISNRVAKHVFAVYLFEGALRQIVQNIVFDYSIYEGEWYWPLVNIAVALIAMVGCMSIDVLAQWMLKPFRKAALKMLGDIINISQKIFICY